MTVNRSLSIPRTGEEPFVSFLIPVYNAERELPATLDSIVKQDDGSIEIICVNDGSSDNSGTVLETYAWKYPFIQVITQENQGITCARNAALEQAHGEWICFVDNDDIVADQAVDVFHKTAEADVDIVYFDYEKFMDHLPDQSANHLGDSMYIHGNRLVKLQSDCINRFKKNVPIISHKTMPTPWAKIYRRSFLTEHGLKFRPDVKHEEDVVFNYELLSYCRAAKKVEYISYYYRWSVESESHRYRPDLIDDVRHTLQAYREIIERCYPTRKDMLELYQYRVLWELLYCTVLGPIHPLNPNSYSVRRQQFRTLLNDPLFKPVIGDRRIRTTRFEIKQSVLATLIRLRWFWMLNRLGKIVGKAR